MPEISLFGVSSWVSVCEHVCNDLIMYVICCIMKKELACD